MTEPSRAPALSRDDYPRPARTYAPTHPCVVDLIATEVESSQVFCDGVVSSPQSIIEPATGTAQPLLGARFDPHQAFQSP